MLASLVTQFEPGPHRLEVVTEWPVVTASWECDVLLVDARGVGEERPLAPYQQKCPVLIYQAEGVAGANLPAAWGAVGLVLTEFSWRELQLTVENAYLTYQLQQKDNKSACRNLAVNKQEAIYLLQALFDHTNLLIAYLDLQMNFRAVNHAYAAADDKRPEFYVGKNHFELFPNKENEAIFHHVAESGEPHYEWAKPFEYAYNRERGMSYWDWNLVPVKDQGGEVIGLVLTLVPVTERVQAVAEAQIAIRDKEALIQEVQHRVKNNLQMVSSLLRLQMMLEEEPQVVAALKTGQTRLQAISHLYQDMYQWGDPLQLNFGQYLQHLANDLVGAVEIADSEIDLETAIDPLFLHVEVAIPLALIASELINNALQHAFNQEHDSKQIEVRLQDKGSEAVLVVQDNGMGFDENQSKPKLGYRLIPRLVKQIEGVFVKEYANGMVCRISFPLKEINQTA
ncbi:MAG TPA: histidine kinase dimerization/phosphoacceptor domain -containing protein [Anaerolineae bacterium]|nr:histidine kinase dimerization/phosphoacceptor domain -containing protein [Anaerolineae bacterium]